MDWLLIAGNFPDRRDGFAELSPVGRRVCRRHKNGHGLRLLLSFKPPVEQNQASKGSHSALLLPRAPIDTALDIRNVQPMGRI
jgi:hypothetical protein